MPGMRDSEDAQVKAESALGRVEELGGTVLWESDLAVVDLSGTFISDAGIRHLEGLASLGTISLDNTRVTATGVQRLHEALPSVEIHFDPPATLAISSFNRKTAGQAGGDTLPMGGADCYHCGEARSHP